MAIDDDAPEALLPGLEAYIFEAQQQASRLTDADLDRRYPVSTGAGLAASNPRLYKAAVRLFFQYGLSQREIAVACHLSRGTVAAIIEAERPRRSSVVQQLARVRRLRGISQRALAALDGLLADPEAVRRAGPAALANIFRALADKADAIEAEVANQTVEPVSSAPESAPVDIDRFLASNSQGDADHD